MERIKGFTLVELVLSMVLLGIVVIVSGVLMGRGVDAYRLVTDRTDKVQQARLAMVRMQKELETLTSVTNASAQQVGFKDNSLADVDFHLTGTTLYRVNDVLATNMTGLTFTYYRSNGNETSAAPQVRRIHIDVTVKDANDAGTLSLRTDVFPRNFIYENFK